MCLTPGMPHGVPGRSIQSECVSGTLRMSFSSVAADAAGAEAGCAVVRYGVASAVALAADAARMKVRRVITLSMLHANAANVLSPVKVLNRRAPARPDRRSIAW